MFVFLPARKPRSSAR